MIPDSARVLGLYPLTSWFVSHGVSNWHARHARPFPTNHRSIGEPSLCSAKAGELSDASQISCRQADGLGDTELLSAGREALSGSYAPVWKSRQRSPNTTVSEPVLDLQRRIDIDNQSELTYTLLFLTRFGKEILTQLNYIIWFSRPAKRHAPDIYGDCSMG